MKKRLIISIFLMFLTTVNLYSVTRSFYNPQGMMVSARMRSLGTNNPVVLGELSGVFINPAVLGGLETMPFTASQQTVLDVFSIKQIGISFPKDYRVPLKKNKTQLQRLNFAFLYGSETLSGIPKTIEDKDQIWSTGTFKSGFQVMEGAVGTSVYDLYGFNEIALGTGLKYTRFFVGGASAGTFSFDAGGIGTRHINSEFIDRTHLGVSVQNLLAPAINITDSGNEGTLPFNFYIGGRVDMFNDLFSLYVHNGYHNIFSLGGEYNVSDAMVLRGSFDTQNFSVGMGIVVDNVLSNSGRGKYSMRVDYNYTQNAAPVSFAPDHAFSISFIGQSRGKTPLILEPEADKIVTQENYLPLKGVGPKNTSMRLYRNNSLVSTTLTDKFGNWFIRRFPLKEGLNLVSLKAYDLDTELSSVSNKILVISDTVQPSVNINIVPEGEDLVVTVRSNENLESISAVVDQTTLLFKRVGLKATKLVEKFEYNQPGVWVAKVPLMTELKSGSPVPNENKVCRLEVKDMAGNESGIIEEPFFAAITFPKDKNVHYKESLRFLGYGSKSLKALMINDYPVYIDPNYQFAMSVPLQPGKNTVRVKQVMTNNQALEYTLRVLRLVTFPDLHSKVKGRREIEFMSTLGVFKADDDGNFYPEKPVTRQFITKLLVSINDEVNVPETVEKDLFTDVPADHPYAPYIKAAVESGMVFAYPDGTYKPEQELSLSETIFMLSNADMIEFQEVEEEEGDVLTRAKLADFLAYTPEYELQIQKLIDWERGYDVQ